MRVSLRKNALVAVAACALASPAARADDLLVMPYACSVRDGRPILRRSPEDEGHRVLGRREQRTVTACSPADPDMCRRWTVYRFDLDCDGARVPWIAVVAEAARHDGVWIEDGRLRLDMGRRWGPSRGPRRGMSPDDPCARAPARGNDWRSRRLDRYCDEREEEEREEIDGSSIVDMPPGFAPMLGIDGIFVAGGAPSTAWAPSIARPSEASPPSFKGADAERPPPPPAPQPAQKSARAESPALAAPKPAAKSAQPDSGPSSSALPELAAKGARIAGLPPAPQQPTKSAKGREATAGATAAPAAAAKPAEAKQAEAKRERTPPPPSPAPAANPGGPVIPRIINRSAAKPDEASPPAARLAAAPPAPPKEALAPDSPVEKAVARKDKDVPLTLMSVIRSPATGAAIVIGTLAVLLLAAFALTRRRERAQLAAAPSRDIATVSLDGSGASLAGATVKGDQQVWTQGQRPSPRPAPAEKPAMPSNWGDRIPATREEALQVLGMGVMPDANLNAIKKIVDGLRASWHPDHASGGADRQMRELRMKQINAAWDIIAGKRAAV